MFKSKLYILLFSSGLLYLSACQDPPSAELPSEPIKTEPIITEPILSLAQVEELMQKSADQAQLGPDFASPIVPLDQNPLFEKTPTGSYLALFNANKNHQNMIKDGSAKILESLASGSVCKASCSPEFKAYFKQDPKIIKSRLSELTGQFISNEIRNQDNYTVFYHGFPNEFRLYQDVLRLIKSFEQLRPLRSTYPFRDLAYDDPINNLESFLKNWWPAYLEHITKQELKLGKKIGPLAKASAKLADTPGKSVGLTYFPDSISYAQNYLLSTNLNFLGNLLSPLNSTVFFLVNSSSATGLNIVDWLIEKTLTPYLLGPDGQLDRPRFDKILAELKAIFNQSMAKSGGQVAQIFVKNSVVPEVAFLAWNGGEPVWFSKGLAIGKGSNPQAIYLPLNVFWPTTAREQALNLYLPNLVDFMDASIAGPTGDLLKIFPLKKSFTLKPASELLNKSEKSPEVNFFVARDLSQARLMPQIKYFSDQAMTGVDIISMNNISQQDLDNYNNNIYSAIRSVLSDFLSKSKKITDFKSGEYPLKQAFINRVK